MRQRAVEEKRDVFQFVSVPLLLAGERLRAHGAWPAIHRRNNGWRRDGALDRVGIRRWLGKIGLRLGGDGILSVARLFVSLTSLSQNNSLSGT